MRLRSGFTVLALALAGCGSSQATSQARTNPRDGASANCAPAGAHILVSDRQASVYDLQKTVYGCALGTPGHVRLGSSGFCTMADKVGPVALSGRIAAYGVQRCGVDTGTAQVVVRRLSDGKVLRSSPATSRVPAAESYQSVGSLAVKADGAVGWIGDGHSIIGRGPEVIEVHRFDARGAARLDQGTGIAVASLRLRGSQLSWDHSGRVRSATLS